jgi:glycosyltransferase involved in cell wall biosynthesis
VKVAFVNQPADLILPPYQTSIGFCTYGVVQPMAQVCPVLVYGREDISGIAQQTGTFERQGVHYRFLKTTHQDELISKLLRRYPQLMRTTNWGRMLPISVSRWQFPDLMRQIAQDLAQQNCDIIHVQHASQFLPILRAHNPTAKIVLHLHAELFPQCNLSLMKRRLRHVNLISSVSDYITNKVRKQFPEFADRCCTFYNGITPGEFQQPKDYAALKARPVKRILYAGAVSPHKGIHTLIDAFNLVAQHFPDVELDIVGMPVNDPIEENFALDDTATIAKMRPLYSDYLGQLRDRLSPLAASKVNFLGTISREALVTRFREADIFAFTPVWDEGFGIPPVEAMASGTPVVATKSGAVVETVQSGRTGFLHEKENVSAIAGSLLQLLRDDALRESMGRAAVQRVRMHFNWERIAATMLEQFEELLSQRQLQTA